MNVTTRRTRSPADRPFVIGWSAANPAERFAVAGIRTGEGTFPGRLPCTRRGPRAARQRKIIDFTADELADLAKNCEIRFDIPGYGIEPRLMTAKLAEAASLSGADREIYDQTVREESEPYMTTLRALYHELGGDAGDNLDAGSLFGEILHKSPSADYEAARKQLAEERARVVAPPADPFSRSRSVVERMLRLQTTAGDALEQLLAARLGADKAHRIRQLGWAGGDSAILYGCPN